MKTFPKLSQTEVRIGIGNGQTINVPMLPISRLGDLKSISEDLAKCSSSADFNSMHDRMIELAGTVMPPQFMEQLRRFDIMGLSELLGYLAYGDPDGDDQPDASKKN